jgi:hypothetical protein
MAEHKPVYDIQNYAEARRMSAANARNLPFGGNSILSHLLA